jgi:hypothetical protein
LEAGVNLNIQLFPTWLNLAIVYLTSSIFLCNEQPFNTGSFISNCFFMPLTPSQRSQIASYRIQIESYRRDLDNLRNEKRRQSEYYSNLIKGTKDSNSKRSYRQSKISTINNINNSIESKKQQINYLRGNIKSVRG